jgi:SAM-dependent methyltransferase
MISRDSKIWENLGQKNQPNWYLDPLVAQSKQKEHLRLIKRWLKESMPERLLKTDLFEEAFGEDQLLFDLSTYGKRFGIDLAHSTVKYASAKAQKNCASNPDAPGPSAASFHFGVADLRALPFKSQSFDLIISTSSLDHFASGSDFRHAVRQIVSALAPGGKLIVTVDNLWNPLYLPLKWLSRFSWAPYPLGYTPSLSGLKKILVHNNLNVLNTDCLVHNPRLISTALFLLLRRFWGNRASPWIAAILKAFSWLDSLPTRYISACFVAVVAEAPSDGKREG